MFLLIPKEIETLRDRHPVSNYIIVLACIGIFLLEIFVMPDEMLSMLILDGWKLPGLVSHIFLHAGFWHLLGNMIFLWVFGNAICANTDSLIYPALFISFGVLAGIIHLLFDAGASGAISGVVGMVVAMYPLNRVYSWWFFMFRAGVVSCSAWVLALFWFAFDLWGVLKGGGYVAYWAHIGGTFAGLLLGLLLLRIGWVRLTEYDNRSLLEMLQGKSVEDRIYD